MRQLLQRHYALKPQAVHSAPHHDVAMKPRHPLCAIGAVVSPEQRHRRHAQRHGYDGGAKIAFVAVLMQRQTRAGFAAVDQARIRRGVRNVGLPLRVLRPLPEGLRHCRPGLPAHGIDAAVALVAGGRRPTQLAAIGQCDRPRVAAGRLQVPQRRLRCQVVHADQQCVHGRQCNAASHHRQGNGIIVRWTELRGHRRCRRSRG